MLLSACLMLLTAPAHAVGSRLEVSVSSSGREVRVAGTLADTRDRPIKRAPVTVRFNAHTVGEATTKGNGHFELQFTAPGDASHAIVVVGYAGDRRHPPAMASGTVQLAATRAAAPTPAPEPAPGTDDTPAPAAPPAPDAAPPAGGPTTPSTTTLTARTRTPTPVNGELVAITGALTAPDGAPLTDAGILLYDELGEVEESYAVTDGNGAFTTYYEIPVEAKGSHPLTLRFDGAGTYPGAEATVALTVQHRPVSTATPSASATPQESAPAETPVATDAPSDAVAAVAHPTTPASGSGAGAILGWFLGGLAAVGGVAIALTVVMVRRIRHRPAAAGGADVEDVAGSGFAMFDDTGELPVVDEPPAAPRRAAR